MTAAVILAAGASSRMGSPKQLLRWRGESLVRRAVAAAIETDLIAVVVGANGAAVRDELNGAGACRPGPDSGPTWPGSVLVVDNPNWPAGMGSSIKAGVAAVLPFDPDAIVILLCDQPHVDAAAVRSLTGAPTDRSMVASGYGGVVGVPALFRRPAFDSLLNLSDDAGARRLFTSRPDQVHVVDLPVAAVDVDTPEDFSRLI